MSDLNADLFNLAMSEEAKPLMAAVQKHIKENVELITEEYYRLNEQKTDRWSWHPRQLELINGAKQNPCSHGLCVTDAVHAPKPAAHRKLSTASRTMMPQRVEPKSRAVRQ